MSETIQILGDISSSISDLIKESDFETIKDVSCMMMGAGISSWAARTKHMQKLLFGKRKKAGDRFVYSMMGAFSMVITSYITGSAGYGLSSLMPYLIFSMLPSSKNQGNDDDYQLKR